LYGQLKFQEKKKEKRGKKKGVVGDKSRLHKPITSPQKKEERGFWPSRCTT